MDKSIFLRNNKEKELKWLILNYQQPLIFKNTIHCNLLNWSLDDWMNALKDEVLQFRRGKFQFTKKPQFQRLTPLENASFETFLNKISKPDQNEWWYFDYKYLKEWFLSVEDVRECISWAPLGFPNITIDECTIWIGSKGAHTPCHQDTYGCNLVLQLYGRKLWAMFPPEENLKPTRVPYEESSVYSKFNFFSPMPDEFKGISNLRKIVLNPGDVLLVPHKWWHYVESLDTSISVNVWLPLPEDHLERLNESVVQLFIRQISKDLSQEDNNIVLNPNTAEDIHLKQMISTISACKNFVTNKKRPKVEETNRLDNRNSPASYNCESIISKYGCIKIPKESPADFVSFLKRQKDRFGDVDNQEIHEEDCNLKSLIGLIDILTNSEVVSLINAKILQNKDL